MIVLATAPLIKMVYWSAVVGVGVATVFSVAVFGVIRSSDMRRARRPGASARFATLGMVALVATAAIAIAGLIVVVHRG
jgi:hypothetical protein